MASKIFPLVFKAGIKRDNTHFQGDYVSNGDWIRWWQAYLRKMDGMTAYNLLYNMPTQKWDVANNVLNYFYITVSNNNLIVITTNRVNVINYSKITNNGNIQATTTTNIANGVQGLQLTSSTLPQIIPVNIGIGAEIQTLFYLGSNLLDINNNTGNVSQFFIKKSVNDNNVLISASIKLTDGVNTSPALSGGIFNNSQYTFIYGSNGLVLVSALNDPYNFADKRNKQNSSGSQFTISEDKVIYGTSTRGTNNNFSLVFWTLSMCVLVTSETPDPNTPTFEEKVPNQLSWNKNIISKNISILSSRCVVECDGLFYWPGTDQFYVYNGMVQDLPNNMNQSYFFDNLDMSKRQLVYGVLNSEYREIWWFYPESTDTSNNYNTINAPNGLMLCTHALIYNVSEQNWYDVAITGTHGQYVPQLGKFFNLGLPKNYPANYNYLFTTNSDASNITLNINGNNNLQRLLTGTASSNTGDSLDGNGGGIAENLFDNNYLTKCEQTILRGNISYDYGNNPQIVQYVGLLFSNNNLNSIGYSIAINGINNINVDPVELYLQNIELTSGIIYWIPLLNNTAYQYYQIQSLGNNILNLSEIYLYSVVPQQQTVVTVPVPSYFTTPIMSFSSYSPVKENDGSDAFMQITRIEPDIKSIDYNAIKMSLRIDTQVYAQSPVISSRIYTFNDSTPRITMYYQGRQVRFSISSTDFFEMGNWFIQAQPGAKQ